MAFGKWNTDGTTNFTTGENFDYDEVNDTWDEVLPPIGAIVGWNREIANAQQSLGSGWLRMEGDVISQGPCSGGTIENLNGNNKFLLGSSSSGAQGGVTSHSHTLNSPNGSVDFNFHGSPYEGVRDNHTHTSANATMTQPYYETIWIFRQGGEGGEWLTSGELDYTDNQVGTASTFNQVISRSIFPIGTVIWWEKDKTGVPPLNECWVECTGGTVTASTSPMSGSDIPDMTSTRRFLRGATASGNSGGSTTHSHGASDGGSPVYGIENYAQTSYAQAYHTHTLNSATNLPPYYGLVPIMFVGTNEYKWDNTGGMNMTAGTALTAEELNNLYKVLPPIGSVFGWHKEFTSVPQTLPDAYVTCGGQTISDADSPMNGQSTLPLNSGSGYLIYANTSSGDNGGASTHNHSHSGTSCNTKDELPAYLWNLSRCSHTHPVSSVSNLPPYMSVQFIQRVK